MPNYGIKVEPVFSAHAEVVPNSVSLLIATLSILRTRGGSSMRIAYPGEKLEYSPRTQR